MRLGCCALCGCNRVAGDFEFRLAGSSRQLFDRMPVAIAGGKIHCGEVAVGAQRGIDQAHALEKLRPIDRGDQSHARDHVAHGHVHRALFLMFGADGFVGSGSHRCQTFVQPGERRGHPRILIAQALDQLNCKGRRQRPLAEASQNDLRGFGLTAAGSQQSVGQGVRFLAHRPIANYPRSRAPQIFHQHDSQRDRNRPELADRQRLHALVGLHEPAQHLRLEAAVGVRDERPRDPENTRVTLKWPFRKFGQPTVKAARKIVADLANLFLRDIEVVDQPLGRLGDGAFLADGLDGGAVRFEQYPAVVPQPFCQMAAAAWSGRDVLSFRQTLGILLEALDAEQFCANRFVVGIRLETCRSTLERAEDEIRHYCL